MAIIAGSLIEVVLRMRAFNMQLLNVWQYEVDNSPGPATAANIGEAWWNHVKATYRALNVAGFGPMFQSVGIRELNNPVGDFADWNIPVGEQTGTRANPAQPEILPPFVAVGQRLLVGTRVTRPGQKRYVCLTESDNVEGNLQAAMIALANTHGAIMDSLMVLGAPAALTEIIPIVCRKDASGFVTAHQPIIGFLTSPIITSQNTRKIGRGA